MNRLLPAVAIVAILILPQAGRAQDFNHMQLSKVESVNVYVVDIVEDGCLPSPDTLRVEAELVLRRSGIAVEPQNERQKRLDAHQLVITPTGFAPRNLPSSCVASLDVTLARWEVLEKDFTSGVVVAVDFGAVLIGSKSEFQDQLRRKVNENVTALANEILKARANQ